MNLPLRLNRNLCRMLQLVGISVGLVTADVVSIFYDQASGPISFAANDVKAALIANGHTPEMLNLSDLKANHANKKVVISIANSDAVKTLMLNEGATAVPALGAQALALRTSSNPQLTYWALGGDSVGSMYAGFEVAENIKLNGFGAAYNLEQAPTMLQRGVKLNLPLDARLPTYGGVNKKGPVNSAEGLSAEKSIANVWDMSFWKTWLDEQARHRYNVVSLWNEHPFPALVKVPGYELASLPYIQGFNGFQLPELTLDKRKAFWKEVMNYAHSRGFQFHWVIWSIQPDYAETQYSQLKDDAFTNAAIPPYMAKSMTAFLNEYPEVDGIGICACDNMPGATSPQAADWAWRAYGQSIFDYAKLNPNRKINIMHRGVKTDLVDILNSWKPLIDQKIFNVDYEVKYANAHMYGVTTPEWWQQDKDAAIAAKQKTWMTIRNDDYFYLDWGDPRFVREYIDNFPDKNLFYAFNIGSDVYQPTRNILYKDTTTYAKQLEVQRNWYIQMLWGRIAYNRNISDDVFIKTMAKRFGLSSGTDLFNAWAKGSGVLPKITELMGDQWKLDLHWYPEAVWGRIPQSGSPDIEAFKTVKEMGDYGPAKGSKLCSLSVSAKETCPTGQKDSYTLANEMEANANEAIRLINTVTPNGSPELDIKIKNVRQIAYLGNYFANKIQAATSYKAFTLKKPGAQAKAIEAARKAYCWWQNYSRAMDQIYRTVPFRLHVFDKSGLGWKYADQFTLADYTTVGGQGVPDCKDINIPVSTNPNLKTKEGISIRGILSNKLQFSLPQNGNYQVTIFQMQGKSIISKYAFQGVKGENQLQLNTKLGHGLFIVRIEAKELSLVANKKLMVSKI